MNAKENNWFEREESILVVKYNCINSDYYWKQRRFLRRVLLHEARMWKSRWEKFKDGCKKVGEWCKNHWKELVIGAICIVIGAVLTVLTGGSFLAVLGIGFKAAAMAGFISGGISVMSSLIVSIFSGDSFKTILGKVLRSFVDGFASGFMWGGIFAGGAQTISAILKFSRSGTLIFGGEQLQLFKPNNFSGKTLGKIKIWSPNGLNNPNSGGTLFKIGKTFRLDFEAGKQLFHTHITYNLYNSMPNFMKSMKWVFDPAKRDVHVRLTSILGGVIGVTQKEWSKEKVKQAFIDGDVSTKLLTKIIKLAPSFSTLKFAIFARMMN